jgi:hypothetical protein
MSQKVMGVSCSLLACSMLSSCVRVIEHNQTAAATAAEHFATTAFIKKDYPTAHGLLSPASRETIPLDKLAEQVAKMHPAVFPTDVKAIEYEPIPGQAAMQIYLKGSAEKEEFYYRFVMSGDRHSGYQVSGLWRGSGPPPASARKPL